MSKSKRPQLIEDTTGRKKLKISLPGGRYQLSLDDRGVNLLCDKLGYTLRDPIPDTIVRILVALGDAWFPHQRDYEKVIEDLPDTYPLNDTVRSGIVEFLLSTSVAEARISIVRDVVRESSLANQMDPLEIEVNELPQLPTDIFGDEKTESPKSESVSEEPKFQSVEEVVDRLDNSTSDQRSRLETRVKKLLDRGVSLETAYNILYTQYDPNSRGRNIFDIPGVGTIRGYKLIDAGADSVEGLAETRPIDLAENSYFNENIATTIVEGAREVAGYEPSTASQLAKHTNESVDTLESALAQLAAAGVPPSGAESTLRELYGPSITDIDFVDGRMAYFLFEAGYKTPWELTQATPEELEEIDYIGPNTVEDVIEGANELIQT